MQTVTQQDQVELSSRPQPPDVAEFLELLNNLTTHSTPEARRLFDNETELFITRAPGRLDVMGGIADYSGSLVLELPIAEAAFVALQRAQPRTLTIVSLSNDDTRDVSFELRHA